MPRRTSDGPAPGTPTHALGKGEIRLGTYRDLWSDFVSERNPALQFLSPSQTLELNPSDAQRLGVQQGQQVTVSANGNSLVATVALRERMLDGTGFLIEGTKEDGANRLAGAAVVTVAAAPEEPAEEPTYGSSEREAVSWS